MKGGYLKGRFKVQVERAQLSDEDIRTLEAVKGICNILPIAKVKIRSD